MTTSTMRCFGPQDGDVRLLTGRRIGFFGYGNQGRAQALNLRDTLCAQSLQDRVSITITALPDETWRQAEEDGFAVAEPRQVAAESDVLFLLVPDEVLPTVYGDHIATHTRAAQAYVFASGYNLTFDPIRFPPDSDVMLLAPRMIGQKMRDAYLGGGGFYSYVSVEQNGSKDAWPVLLALAQGIGTLRCGAFELSARDETVLDLFHEQGFGALFGTMIMEMIRIGQEAGLPPEALVLDFYLSGEIAESMQAMADVGFVEQSYLHSRTSQYGGMTRALRVDRAAIRRHLETVLEEITTGTFAREWTQEQATGAERFENLRAAARKHNPFTPIEQSLRARVAEAQQRRADP
jgi:ketol-acid reductoisomerase